MRILFTCVLRQGPQQLVNKFAPFLSGAIQAEEKGRSLEMQRRRNNVVNHKRATKHCAERQGKEGLEVQLSDSQERKDSWAFSWKGGEKWDIPTRRTLDSSFASSPQLAFAWGSGTASGFPAIMFVTSRGASNVADISHACY
eukprot:499264-Pelagomonas_calceolata.AAC.2